MAADTISNAEIIQEFLAETRENMDQMEHDLMAWEKQPTARETLDQIFRAVHTLKGTCGFLGFANLETVAHEAENLLVCVRDGQVGADARVITVLLQVLDTIRRHLAHIERTGDEEKQGFGCVLSDLRALQSNADKTGSPAAATPDQPEGMEGPASESSIRVEIGLLDRLMNLVGELVLTRNQISQISLSSGQTPLIGTSQKLSHITSELQESIMKTRLQPIGNIWAKFPRLVRDAAMASGKKIRVEMSGQQTELDKSIIEVIKDPLTHLIRNCIDHGIETPERRVSCGKPEEGIIRLKAFHEAGLVHMEISDDGGGIRPELIREAARRRGLVSATEADELTNHDLMQLIFLPGFSTAREVTKLSGRGVGMDVVKTNLERISGSVEVSSSPGEGTLFKIRIPLTLAIVPALIVASGGERFAIPQVNLRELVRLEGAEIRKIESVQNARLYRLRDRLLPLICLREVLGFPAPTAVPRPEDEVVSIIVLESGSGPFGLIVDRVYDTQEIVVKPLGRQLKSVTVFAGATIMGDGLVALILDVMGLAQHSRLAESSELLQKMAPVPEPARAEEEGPSETLLLFELGAQSRCAIPLSEVTRLEEFSASEIEWEGSTRVVQYRDQIMPLLPLRQRLLDEEEKTETTELSDNFQVIVHAGKSGYHGLLVDRIIDIAHEPLVLQRHRLRPGVRGSAVIQRRVTKILDVEGLIKLEQKGRAKRKSVKPVPTI